MSATSKSSLPAPRNYEEETSAKRAEMKAAFIRETSAKVLVEMIAINPRSPSISAVISVDAAELLAKTLANKGYL